MSEVENSAQGAAVISRREPGVVARNTMRVFAASLLILGINQSFNLGFFVKHTLIENQYLYGVLALSVPLVFFIFPLRNNGVIARWIDWVLAIISFVTLGYFFLIAYDVVARGWEMSPPPDTVIMATVLWAIIIEAGRRAGGAVLASVALFFSLYPLFADQMPGPISAFASPFYITASYHAMGLESILGIPLKAFATLVFGFVLFGAALEHTGAGRFFINLAFALLGHVRGGPAKVAILSSGLMGSVSGSVVTNVMTTGVMTIPAMRRNGMTGVSAAGIETCASTGGVLMPPVMGAAAFVMANFLQLPYAQIAIAAAVPAFLYFFGLFVQIDARAARLNLSGMDKSELPDLRETIAQGWYHLFSFGLLIYMLLVLKQEMFAPFYATAVLLVVNQIFSKTNRWDLKIVLAFIDSLATLFSTLTSTLAAVGMIIGGLSLTGLAGTLVNDLLHIAGDSPFMLLLMGAITSLILGVGMTATACYIFLAVMLAPALIQVGFEPLSVHLFIFYWGMLSFITPPVALGAFAAASVAGTPPMRTGFESMRIGSIIYFIPFFFVYDPALILIGPWNEILISVSLALFGVFLFANVLQGYLPVVGPLFVDIKGGALLRLPILLGALLIALPAKAISCATDLNLLMLGLAIIAPFAIAASFLKTRTQSRTE